LKSIEAGSQNLITGSLKISSDVAPPELVITLALTAEPSWVAVRGRVIYATQRIAERGGQTVGTTQSPPTAVVLVSSVFSEFWIAPVESDGTFNFARVLPGRYEVRGFPDTTNTPSMDVNIGRSAVVNIDLTLPNVRAVPCPAC
jgi:hypothetical protein